ncbi:MAG: glycogen/starch/alpha-glucan phosphorylase, partial [Clostridiaceae bacterium]|nr:glycogen/starch/alpha-glucan phosphorylase [Clostridiaceae bacterium]
MLDTKEFKITIERILKTGYGKSTDKAKDYEKYNALSKAVMGIIIDNWNKTAEAYAKGKQAYYLSAEFLMGRALGNNLMNLGIYDEVKKVLEELNININDIEEIEEDAGLGNGGLGRLAACFMDSSAATNIPLTGYGIRYSHGLFKQSFKEGFQMEQADNWIKYGDPWSIRCEDDAVIVEFGDEKVKAIPYDTPIIGYGTNNINKLRLFKAEPLQDFDFELFNSQEYTEAVKEKNRAEDISRVLYPNDSTVEGKMLRLKQQYFFVSAALKDLVRSFKKQHGNNFELFKDYHAIQLNDTHPVVAIPELMRILIDEEKLSYDKAWQITVATFSYTNHTILREALEEWDIELYKKLIPSVYKIVKEIDKRFMRMLGQKKYSYEKINSMKIIYKGRIRMAWLAIHGTHATNGVAELHTDILKNQELKDWYELYPDRFLNKTNGITPRRWLALCNKELSAFITELLGSDNWITDLSELKDLEKYIDDKVVLN